MLISAIIKQYRRMNLLVGISCGIVIGVVLALLVPQASFIALLGTIFVGALKAIAPILVFVLVISSLANAQQTPGKRFRTVIILYLASTLLAAVAAVFASRLFPVTLTLTHGVDDLTPPSGISEVFKKILENCVSNPVASIGNANYIGILFWAIVLGVAFKRSSDNTKQFLANCSQSVSNVVRWVIAAAPSGICGLVFDAVSTSGLAIFEDYGKLVLVIVGCMLFVALVIDPLLAGLTMRRNPYPLVFKCLKESGLTAFFTRSSAANIPVNMKLCENLGLDKDAYSVSVPLGASINMNGAAVTITIMTLAATHTLGIAVDIPSAIVLSILATLSACGASGVAGGSLLLIPMACSLFGIPNDVGMQVVGVGFISVLCRIPLKPPSILLPM